MQKQHPTPVVTPLVQEHVDRARDGEFTVQRCERDGARFYPPSSNCPTCLGTDLSWQPVSGRATLWSWITIHQPYLKAFTDEIPYVVAYVELEEGPYLMSTLIGVDPADLRRDLPLQLALEPYGADDVPLPVFSPA